MMLQCNVITHWLGTFTKWTLILYVNTNEHFGSIIAPCRILYYVIFIHVLDTCFWHQSPQMCAIAHMYVHTSFSCDKLSNLALHLKHTVVIFSLCSDMCSWIHITHKAIYERYSFYLVWNILGDVWLTCFILWSVGPHALLSAAWILHYGSSGDWPLTLLDWGVY